MNETVVTGAPAAAVTSGAGPAVRPTSAGRGGPTVPESLVEGRMTDQLAAGAGRGTDWGPVIAPAAARTAPPTAAPRRHRTPVPALLTVGVPAQSPDPDPNPRAPTAPPGFSLTWTPQRGTRSRTHAHPPGPGPGLSPAPGPAPGPGPDASHGATEAIWHSHAQIDPHGNPVSVCVWDCSRP